MCVCIYIYIDDAKIFIRLRVQISSFERSPRICKEKKFNQNDHQDVS